MAVFGKAEEAFYMSMHALYIFVEAKTEDVEQSTKQSQWCTT